MPTGRLELAMWMPEAPRRPFVRVTEEELAAVLRAAGFSPSDALSAVHAWKSAIEQKARLA